MTIKTKYDIGQEVWFMNRNKCECYELFKLSDVHKEDLKDKVKEIMNVMKEE